MKKSIFLLIFTSTAICTFAQDIIVTRDAKRIEAKILEVSSSEIKYKEYNYQDGPLFILNTSEINTIIYQNGSVKIYGQDQQNTPQTVTPQAQTTVATQQTNTIDSPTQQPETITDIQQVIDSSAIRPDFFDELTRNGSLPIITKEGDVYYANGYKMTWEQYLMFIQENCQEAYSSYKTGKKLQLIGWNLFAYGAIGTGIGGLLTGIGINALNRDYAPEFGFVFGMSIPGIFLIAAGASSVIASFPCLIISTKKRNHSYEVYNEVCAKHPVALEFDVQASQNGIGLAMKF